MIVHTSGEPAAEPLIGEEGIVFADIDIADSIEAKQAHDIVGHYQRFDVFRLEVDQRPREPIELIGAPDGPAPAAARQPEAEALADALEPDSG